MRLLALALSSALVLGCGGSPPVAVDTTQTPGYPTVLRAPSEFAGDFALEQEVTIRHPEDENSFRAAVQKIGDEIIVLALGPHGGRGFALRQVGRDVTFENFLPVELPFPPEYILFDVHRSWFQPTAAPDGGEGTASFERDGERIRERWEDGRLLERTFERADGAPDGTIAVRFPEGLEPTAPHRSRPPDLIELDNGWFGYQASVRTLSWQPVDPPEEE
ncbi:MAG: DUF3261 domain-containing protein [Myxococcota bacterium]